MWHIIVAESLPLSALPYGTQSEYQNIKPVLIDPEKDDLSGRIMACLYLDLKAMQELKEHIDSGHREAPVTYDNLLMSASCASLLQMYLLFYMQHYSKRYNKETKTIDAISVYQNETDIPSPYFLLGDIKCDIQL